MSDTLNLNKIDQYIENSLKNKYVSSSIILFISLYACLIVPKLPPSYLTMMDTPLFKLLTLFSIGYISTKHYGIAIASTIAFFITLNSIQKYETSDKLLNIMVIDATTNGNTVDNEIKPIFEIKKQAEINNVDVNIRSLSEQIEINKETVKNLDTVSINTENSNNSTVHQVSGRAYNNNVYGEFDINYA
jgi:hypothetical protein